jgi:hypothetical protein
VNTAMNIGFEVLTSVTMNGTILWIVTPCISETGRRVG